MGGRGNTGSRNSNTGQRSVETMDGYIGKGAVEDAINDKIRHSLGMNEEYASVINMNVISTPEEIESAGGYAEVEASYSVSVRVPFTYTDSDGYTHTEYEDDTEYRSGRFNVLVLR